MQIAFEVFAGVFFHVRRKTEPTEPTEPGTEAVIFFKLTLMLMLSSDTHKAGCYGTARSMDQCRSVLWTTTAPGMSICVSISLTSVMVKAARKES